MCEDGAPSGREVLTVSRMAMVAKSNFAVCFFLAIFI